MEEQLRGTGMLRTTVRPARQWNVGYEFFILTSVVSKSGLPPVKVVRSARGTVWALNNEEVPLGTYELTAEGGETLRVQNIGVAWSIISPA
jgi:hypothetical protein